MWTYHEINKLEDGISKNNFMLLRLLVFYYIVINIRQLRLLVLRQIITISLILS